MMPILMLRLVLVLVVKSREKSRADAIQFARFTLKKPLVAYPYSIYLDKISIDDGRNGSIGNEVLKRFNVIFDNQESNYC